MPLIDCLVWLHSGVVFTLIMTPGTGISLKEFCTIRRWLWILPSVELRNRHVFGHPRSSFSLLALVTSKAVRAINIPFLRNGQALTAIPPDGRRCRTPVSQETPSRPSHSHRILTDGKRRQSLCSRTGRNAVRARQSFTGFAPIALG